MGNNSQAVDMPVFPVTVDELNALIDSASPDLIDSLSREALVGSIKNLLWYLKRCRLSIYHGILSADSAALEHCAGLIQQQVDKHNDGANFEAASHYEHAQTILREQADKLLKDRSIQTEYDG